MGRFVKHRAQRVFYGRFHDTGIALAFVNYRHASGKLIAKQVRNAAQVVRSCEQNSRSVGELSELISVAGFR